MAACVRASWPDASSPAALAGTVVADVLAVNEESAGKIGESAEKLACAIWLLPTDVLDSWAARVRFERAMRDLRRLVRHAGELSRVRAYVL